MNHEYTGALGPDHRPIVFVEPLGRVTPGWVTRYAGAWEYACLDALQDGMRAVSS